jgi:hypothetical protein
VSKNDSNNLVPLGNQHIEYIINLVSEMSNIDTILNNSVRSTLNAFKLFITDLNGVQIPGLQIFFSSTIMPFGFSIFNESIYFLESKQTVKQISVHSTGFYKFIFFLS